MDEIARLLTEQSGLFYEPAALGGWSALRAVTGPGWRRHADHSPIEIAVDISRNVRPVEG